MVTHFGLSVMLADNATVFFSLNVTWPLRFKHNSSAIRIQYNLIHGSDCSHVVISFITLSLMFLFSSDPLWHWINL